MNDLLHPPIFASNATPAACYWKRMWYELNCMRQTMDFCDITLTTNDGQTFMAHSLMLVAGSSLFRKYISDNISFGFNNMNSKLNIELTNITSYVMEVVLNFIYGIKPISNEQILNLCIGSKLLEVDEAYKYCLHCLNVNSELIYSLRNKFDITIVNTILEDAGYSCDIVDEPGYSDSIYKDTSFINEGSLKNTNLCENLNSLEQITEICNNITHNNFNECELKFVNNIENLDINNLKSDDNFGKLTELSFIDLTQNNECPHLKNLKICSDYIQNDNFVVNNNEIMEEKIKKKVELNENFFSINEINSNMDILNQIDANLDVASMDDIESTKENYDISDRIKNVEFTLHNVGAVNNNIDQSQLSEKFHLKSNENINPYFSSKSINVQKSNCDPAFPQSALMHEFTSLLEESNYISHVDELVENNMDGATEMNNLLNPNNIHCNISSSQINNNLTLIEKRGNIDISNVSSSNNSAIGADSKGCLFSCTSRDTKPNDSIIKTLQLLNNNCLNLNEVNKIVDNTFLFENTDSNSSFIPEYSCLSTKKDLLKKIEDTASNSDTKPLNDNILNNVHKPQLHIKSVRRPPNFICQDCGEVLNTSYKLQTHQLKEHHKGKLFICKHCNFKSPRKKDLQAHCLSQHDEQPPGVKIYICTSCQYKCIDKNRFEEHEAMHIGIPKFKCTLCDKAYTTRRGMKTHLKYHNVSRPFKCTMCSAAFKVKSKLTDHMKLVHIQKGFKPYKCGYCNHFTALRGNCNQHIKKNHPGLPVVVIDTASDKRKFRTNYDYANLEGSDIDEHQEIGSNIRRS